MKRTIFHVDMDSYFASVEQQANPGLREKPIVVTGKPTIKTVVAAASREAKKYGIKSAMATWEARDLCPELTLIPGDPDKYEWVTGQFLTILRQFSPRLEVFGIDEAFLDLTSMTNHLGSPFEVAQKIKQEIEKSLGSYLTCSIGIAKNKLLAKLASDMDKPDGITIIEDQRVPLILEDLPLTDLCGIGSRIERRLNRLGIYTPKELGEASQKMLKEEFGVIGNRLKLMGQGKDPTPVVPAWKKDPVKSIGNSLTLPEFKRTPEKALPILYKLSQKVGYRLRKQDLMGKTVKLHVRDNDLLVKGKQSTLGRYTNNGNIIYQTCHKIRQSLPFPKTPTMVGVRVSNLKSKQNIPDSIFPQEKIKGELLHLIDSINEEFGDQTLYFAAQSDAKEMLPHTGSFRRPATLKKKTKGPNLTGTK